MKVYEGANVRNVAVVGHGHAGKTSLISAMLYTAGATQRQGRVDDGTATTDYDEEEILRKMSISASLAYAEWGNTKINFIDTPGFNMFVHEAKLVLPVVDAAVVVVDGVAGVEVVTERVWNDCEEYKTPRVIVASRMDRERADAERVLESLTNAFGRSVIPLELPIGKEKSLIGRGGSGPHEGLHLRAGRKRQRQRRRDSREHEGRGAGSARAAGGADRRRRRRADGRVLRQGNDSRRTSGSGAAQRDSRGQDFSGAVCFRPGKCKRRPADGLHRGIYSGGDGA